MILLNYIPTCGEPMYPQRHKCRLCCAFLSIFLTALCPLVFAVEPIPLTIEADQAKINEKAGVSTYRGNVLVKRDTIEVHADEITVQSRDGKFDKIIAIGKPVKFSREGDEKSAGLAGEAQHLEFLADSEKVILIDNARLSQGKNTFSGHRIEYDSISDVVTAGISGAEQPTAGDTDQRVRVTIHPETNSNTPETAKESQVTP